MQYLHLDAEAFGKSKSNGGAGIRGTILVDRQ